MIDVQHALLLLAVLLVAAAAHEGLRSTRLWAGSRAERGAVRNCWLLAFAATLAGLSAVAWEVSR